MVFLDNRPDLAPSTVQLGAKLRSVVAPSVVPDIQNDLPILVMGGPPPDMANVSWTVDTRAAFSAIALVGHVEPFDLAAVLDGAVDPAVPIGNFNGVRHLRHDFLADALNASTVARMMASFAPICRRLADLPFQAVAHDRSDLIILRLAYSRMSAITACLDPESRLLVEYPVLGRSSDVRRRLEALAESELLRRAHFARTHTCKACSSARLHAYEACPDCGGGDLHEQPLVHHYACGWQEAESRFVRDHQLVCPKCRRELRHYGVDYDKPGMVAVCNTCGTGHSEPAVRFACLDCGSVTSGEDAEAVDWYHYSITEEGRRALHEGRLPDLHVGSLLDGHSRAFSSREFRLMALSSLKVAQRYDRPFTIARLWIDNLDALSRERGRSQVHAGFALAIGVIIEALAESDFVTADGSSSILIAFPETSRRDAAAVIERLVRTVADKVAIPFDLKAHVAERGAIIELVPEG